MTAPSEPDPAPLPRQPLAGAVVRPRPRRADSRGSGTPRRARRGARRPGDDRVPGVLPGLPVPVPMPAATSTASRDASGRQFAVHRVHCAAVIVLGASAPASGSATCPRSRGSCSGSASSSCPRSRSCSGHRRRPDRRQGRPGRRRAFELAVDRHSSGRCSSACRSSPSSPRPDERRRRPSHERDRHDRGARAHALATSERWRVAWASGWLSSWPRAATSSIPGRPTGTRPVSGRTTGRSGRRPRGRSAADRRRGAIRLATRPDARPSPPARQDRGRRGDGDLHDAPGRRPVRPRVRRRSLGRSVPTRRRDQTCRHVACHRGRGDLRRAVRGRACDASGGRCLGLCVQAAVALQRIGPRRRDASQGAVVSGRSARIAPPQIGVGALDGDSGSIRLRTRQRPLASHRAGLAIAIVRRRAVDGAVRLAHRCPRERSPRLGRSARSVSPGGSFETLGRGRSGPGCTESSGAGRRTGSHARPRASTALRSHSARAWPGKRRARRSILFDVDAELPTGRPRGPFGATAGP